MEKRYKILLVDDEEDNLSLLNRTLRHDFDLIQTTSPLQGLEHIKTETIDLILSDHKMSEMDGVEFLRRSFELNPNAVRLLVTAYSDSKILIDAINYGKIYRYIKKPWEPAELLIIVNSALEYQQLKLENDKLINDLKELFSGTINAIIEALDAKDSYTLGRSRRVTFFAMKMAKHLNLPLEEIGKLELAGLLHDIGMIGVPEEVLNRVESLSESDYEKVKKHVENGVKILEDIKQLKEVVEIIKYHHEGYDGNGYPHGIRGEEIPLNARIISVADAYDGMVSNRAYRSGVLPEEAIRKIEEQSGHQFDPLVIDAFKAIIQEAMAEIREYELLMSEQSS